MSLTPIQAGAPVLDTAALGRLMPLYLWLGPDGRIRGAGATLGKLFPGTPLIGRELMDLFALQRPRNLDGVADLAAQAGTRIKLTQRAAPHTSFRGLAVPLAPADGIMLNLSFGIAISDAVREHRLTDSDFAPTDLAIEMLYLVEAKSAVLDELRDLNRRLGEAKAAAEQQALTDTLTGLDNRRALDRALAEAVRARRPFGLMHLDLDYFKAVNDTFGHAAGDHVLARVAAILGEETRTADRIARVGGDEFVVMLPGLTDPKAVERVAARILARLEAPIDYNGAPCRIAASIGITSTDFYPAPEPDRLLSDADRALYAAKRAGRGRVTVFDDGLAGDAPRSEAARPGAEA